MKNYYQQLSQFSNFEDYAKSNLEFFKTTFLPQFIPSKLNKKLWPGEIIQNILNQIEPTVGNKLFYEYSLIYKQLTLSEPDIGIQK